MPKPAVRRGARRSLGAVERRTSVAIGEVAVVHVGVDGSRDEPAIVDVRGQEQLVRQELRAGEIHEVEEILGDVRRVTGLTPIRQHARRNGAVAVQAGIRIRVAQVEIGSVVLPADLAEALPEPRGRVVPPTRFIEVSCGQKIIEVADGATRLRLEGPPAEGPAGRLELTPWIIVAAAGPY